MKLVGRYQIKSRIGQGAMANVYRAYDPEIQRELAIKVLNQQFPARSGMRVALPARSTRSRLAFAP